jgi:hypothetical protein
LALPRSADFHELAWLAGDDRHCSTSDSRAECSSCSSLSALPTYRQDQSRAGIRVPVAGPPGARW